jgi:SAM-dependent methyltransferase
VLGETYEATRLGNPAVRRRLSVMERIILERVRGFRRALDIGCGTGRFTSQLQVHEAVGLDRSQGMLDLARKRRLTCVLGDAHALPFKSDAFDAVVATDHVFSALDIERALREAHRVLAPGGLLAIHYPTHAVWTPRKPFGLTPVPGRRGKSAVEVVALAARLALELENIRLWRWLRWYPYLFSVPPLLSLQVWTQGVLVFRKRSARSSRHRTL